MLLGCEWKEIICIDKTCVLVLNTGSHCIGHLGSLVEGINTQYSINNKKPFMLAEGFQKGPAQFTAYLTSIFNLH